MSGTTISAALRRIRKLKGQIAEDRATAAKMNNWMMGQEPPFKFGDLVARVDAATAELVKLTAAVAQANADALVTFDGREVSLQLAIKTLQELKGEIAWFKALSCMPHPSQNQELEQKGGGYGQPAQPPRIVQVLCAFTEPMRVEKVRALQDKFDALNDALEHRNHEVTVEV